MAEYQYRSEDAFTVSGFFTKSECEGHIALAEERGFSDAPINTSRGPQIRKNIRNNTRVMIDDVDQATRLWSRIQDYVPIRVGPWVACGVNERLRYYRYDCGQQFDWHCDGAFERDNGERSQLTFMVYLNDDFSGGATTIDAMDIAPQQGMALLFIHQVLHKGQPVTDGRKYVLRTDVMYRLENKR